MHLCHSMCVNGFEFDWPVNNIQYVSACDLKEPHKLVTVCVHTRACTKDYKLWKGGTLDPGRQAELLFILSSTRLPPHLASYTCAHTSNPILANPKCIRPKWTRVCYVLSVENTDRRKAGAERAAGSSKNLWYYDRRGKASKDTITYLVTEIIIIIPGNVSKV